MWAALGCRTSRTSALSSSSPRPNKLHQVSLGSPRRAGLFIDYHDTGLRRLRPAHGSFVATELGVIMVAR